MKVTTERLPGSQVVLEIEIDQERVERSLEQAYRRLVHRTRVPGFRPGKAPRVMLERYLGHGVLLREALDRLVPEVYEEATKEQGIEPVDAPDLEITSLEPVTFKATVPVRPTVELGDYKSLRIEREPVEVSEEAVQQDLEALRRRYAYLQPVDRPARSGDIVLADITGSTEEGHTVVHEEETEVPLREDAPVGPPGLVEAIIGMRPGEEKEFPLHVPDGFRDPRLAGKTVKYRVKVHEVKQEQLPELNDAFARQVGEGFTTLSLLRERLRADRRRQSEEAARRRDEERALDALVAQAKIEFPAVLLEREIDRMLSEQMAPGHDLERQLQRLGKSEAERREELRPEATEKLRRSLVLTEFARREEITVTPEEIDAEIERMAADMPPEQAEQWRQLFGTESGREVVRRSLFTRKALDRLLEITSGAPTSAAPAPAKRARRAPRSAAAEVETRGGEAADAARENLAKEATER